MHGRRSCSSSPSRARRRSSSSSASPRSSSGATRASPSRPSTASAGPEPQAFLDARPSLTICLAHFGGAGDWEKYLDDQWDVDTAADKKSWLAKIADMIRSERYENLYTDVSYTIFTNEEYVYLLKVLLSDEALRAHVLFGFDFYVGESAELEEQRRSVRARAVLGEELFQTIAYDNPRGYVGEA